MRRMQTLIAVCAFVVAGTGLACSGGGGADDVQASDGSQTTCEDITVFEGACDLPEGVECTNVPPPFWFCTCIDGEWACLSEGPPPDVMSPDVEETTGEDAATDEGNDEGAADEGTADEGTTDEGATDEGAADEGAATDEGNPVDEGAALDEGPPGVDTAQPDSEASGDTGGPQDSGNPIQCTGVCGDTNNDGVVNDQDVVALGGVLQGNPSNVCADQQSDVITDGNVTVADLNALRALVNGTGWGGCEYCSFECGDINADGNINVLDVGAMNAILSNGTPDNVCTLWSADVNGDGVIISCPLNTCDSADSDLLTGFILGEVELNCAPAIVIPQG